jgi:hypothetical protein
MKACVIAGLALSLGGLKFATHHPLPLPYLAYVGLLLYVLLFLALTGKVLLDVLKRDWIYASLMIMPFPVLAQWMLSSQDRGNSLAYKIPHFGADSASLTFVMLALAVTSAGFIRLKSRVTKLMSLLIVTPMLVAVSLSNYEEMSIFLLGCLSLLSISVLLAPALLDHLLNREGALQASIDVQINAADSQ